MSEDNLQVRELLDHLLHALEEFTAGNRGKLFDSRQELRELSDRVVESPWCHVTPICESVQKVLGNVLRYGVLGEEESVALATELLTFVYATLHRSPTGALTHSTPHGSSAESEELAKEVVEDSRLGEVLVRQGSIKREQLVRALELQRVCHQPIGEVLLSMDALDREHLEKGLEHQKRLAARTPEPQGAGPGGLRLVSPTGENPSSAEELEGGPYRPRMG